MTTDSAMKPEDRPEGSEERIHATWSAYWRDKAHGIDEWDTLSAVILATLEQESHGFSARRVLEAGCGSGRISREIAKRGGQLVLLDIAIEALETSRRTFGAALTAEFVEGSILDLPPIGSFDLVWNAGVIEHFDTADQIKIVRDLGSRVRPGGSLVILTPYSRSILYRTAKWLLERLKRWPYGREIPISTLQPLMSDPALQLREYTIAFLPFFFDAHKFCSFLAPLSRPSGRLALKLLGERAFATIDAALSRLFGGYLLVSVVEAAPRRHRSERES